MSLCLIRRSKERQRVSSHLLSGIFSGHADQLFGNLIWRKKLPAFLQPCQVLAILSIIKWAWLISLATFFLKSSLLNRTAFFGMLLVGPSISPYHFHEEESVALLLFLFLSISLPRNSNWYHDIQKWALFLSIVLHCAEFLKLFCGLIFILF